MYLFIFESDVLVFFMGIMPPELLGKRERGRGGGGGGGREDE